MKRTLIVASLSLALIGNLAQASDRDRNFWAIIIAGAAATALVAAAVDDKAKVKVVPPKEHHPKPSYNKKKHKKLHKKGIQHRHGYEDSRWNAPLAHRKKWKKQHRYWEWQDRPHYRHWSYR